MGGEKNTPGGGREADVPQPISPGEAEFVVVERDHLNNNTEDARYDDAAGSMINTPSSPGRETTTFAPGTFNIPGTSLSASTTSTRSSMRSTTVSDSADVAPGTTTTAASGAAETADNGAYAAADCAVHRGAAGAAIVATAQAVLEFLYAYAVVAYHEGLALVERGCNLAKEARRRWNERGPVRPGLKRLVRGKFIPAVLGILLTLVVVVVAIPSYLAMPSSQNEAMNLSAQEWQAKYEEMLSKHSVDSMRSRLKYDKLAGKHLELQADYEALRDSVRAKPQHTSRSKANAESCSSDAVQGPVAAVRDALAAAEKSAYDMYRQFSDALREDIREVRGLFGRKTREWLDALQ